MKSSDRTINNHIQQRLMIIAGIIIVIYAIILSIAPSIKFHSGFDQLNYLHWAGVFVWIATFSFLHFQSTRLLTHRDPFILPITALLSGFGLLTIWRLYPELGQRQSIWLILAGILFFTGIKFSDLLTYLRRYKYLWLTLGLMLTLLTIFWGTNPGGSGPKLWLRIFNVHFQPSEPLKLLLIIFLAGFFTDRLLAVYGKARTLLPTFFLTGIALLLLVYQQDLGTASIFLLLYFGMLYISRGNKWMIGLVPALVLLTGLMGYFLVDIVQIRIDSWLNPFSDPSGASYQVIQSLIGIAEGGLIGTGVGLGNPRLIPVSVSDFIFSAIAEELGFFSNTSIASTGSL
ncbi:MAG: FtsW/RodA/SpoVE family cell cycle protein, partial [Anaerolineales bacterium]